MGLPRVRFTVRWLMVAVAFVALALGVEVTRRRWAEFRQRAKSYAAMEQYERSLLDGWSTVVRREDGRAVAIRGPIAIQVPSHRGGYDEIRVTPTPGYDAANLRLRADYHARLKRKYERATRYPWLPVAPDPPEPK